MSFRSRSCCWASRTIRGRAHGNILLFLVPRGPVRSLTPLLEQHAAGDNLSIVWLVLNHGDLFGVRPAAGSEQIRQVGRVIAIAVSDHQVLGVVFEPVDRYAVFVRSDSHSDDLLWSLNLRQILRGGLQGLVVVFCGVFDERLLLLDLICVARERLFSQS